jgi:hypothetical protein
MKSRNGIFRELITPPVCGIFLFVLIFALPFLAYVQVSNNRALSNANDRIENRNLKIDSLSKDLSTLSAKHDSLRHYARQYHPDVIWTARAIYSETDSLHEMKYVGWVIRNRVDMGFNGKHTYRDVVLDRYQFSAFNPGRRGRVYYATKSWYDQFGSSSTSSKRWKEALDVASKVVFADSSQRPFPIRTLYFYSEVSMPRHKKHPRWAYSMKQTKVIDVAEKRFRFFVDPDYRVNEPAPTVFSARNRTYRNTKKITVGTSL